MRFEARVLVALVLWFASVSCGAPAVIVSDASVAPNVISPNADGSDDLAWIRYRLHVPARVSIYLTDAAGRRHYIRREVLRVARPVPYELLFNGIGENGRLLPNGEYTWTVEAVTDDGYVGRQSGTLIVREADLPAPKIGEFTTSTNAFTPNRDAIEDHVYINVVTLTPGRLRVYVMGEGGFRYEVPRQEGLRRLLDEDDLLPGRYFYDYDGGIDLGADPPPDGEYVIVAELEDRVGQRDVLTAPLTIRDSGRPVAEIVIQPNGNGIAWSGVGRTPELTLRLGDTLYFTTTIRNVGTTPIRTAGPFDPNDCYTMSTNRYTKGYPEEPGVWRVGINYETNTGEDHPWRWAVGTLDDLEKVEHNGATLYYLPPGKQVVVRGCIVLDRIPPRNPFRIWGALIQEQVEIAPINSYVTPILVTLVEP
ncbi:MAG: hypothetical protein RMM31_10225 [Anaerolineae bacterium]|nr:hypothetical protein [Thermoflexales bacterium]MDW8396603.1 hypothetical protein [Anaerolineae bacterium]